MRRLSTLKDNCTHQLNGNLDFQIAFVTFLWKQFFQFAFFASVALFVTNSLIGLHCITMLLTEQQLFKTTARISRLRFTDYCTNTTLNSVLQTALHWISSTAEGQSEEAIGNSSVQVTDDFDTYE
jgi:hypothetical protein